MSELAALRFLVVDDFRAMRRVVRVLLKEIGCDSVEEAGDGAAALAALRAQPFDVVISDIAMPTMSGLELLEAIKADPKLRHVQVLMVTAEARKDEIVQAAQSGAAGYVVKPFSRETLEKKLLEAMPKAGVEA